MGGAATKHPDGEEDDEECGGEHHLAGIGGSVPDGQRKSHCSSQSLMPRDTHTHTQTHTYLLHTHTHTLHTHTLHTHTHTTYTHTHTLHTPTPYIHTHTHRDTHPH